MTFDPLEPMTVDDWCRALDGEDPRPCAEVIDFDAARSQREPASQREWKRHCAWLALTTARRALRVNTYAAYSSAGSEIDDIYLNGDCRLPEILALGALMMRRCIECRTLLRERQAARNLVHEALRASVEDSA